jgi:acyl-CoA thioesterase
LTSRAELLTRWNACGFYRLVGMEVLRADEAGSAFQIAIDERHLQAYGTAHGGVLAGLVDAAMGLAILGRVPDADCATVELKVNFLAPALPGELTAHGRVVSQARRTVVAWADAADATGALVACGLGTFRLLGGSDG